jgi:uncharacterized protein (TIGR02444 family)
MSGEIEAPSTDAFWDFAVSVYAANGVSDECLALQDRDGLDVNLLLFCAYAGLAYGRAFDDADLENLTQDSAAWQRDVVGPLRAARIAMKPLEQDPRTEVAHGVAALRQTVKESELAAERIEHAILIDWMRGHPGHRAPDGAAAAVANIAALLARHGIGPHDRAQRVSHLIRAARRYFEIQR